MHPTPSPASPVNYLSRGHKLAYGIGGVVDLLAVWVLVGVAFPIFEMGLGIAPVVVGTSLLVFRFWDAISDPVMGWVTDRVRTPWGRRKPYMIVGAVACSVLYPLLWHFPLEASQPVIIAWFLGFGILFYTAFTVWNIPYQSLLFELSPDYHERTRIASIRNAFVTMAMLVSGWVWWGITHPWLSTASWLFGVNPAAEEVSTAIGMRNLSLVFGVVFLIAGLIPVIFVRERRETPEEERVRSGAHLGGSFITEFILTLKNRYFLALAGMTLLLLLGPQMVSTFGMYMLRYYVAGGDEVVASRYVGYGGTLYIVVNLISIPLFVRLSRSIGKLPVIRIGMVLMALSSLLTLVIFVPGRPELTLLAQFLGAPGQAAIWSILPSMTADIVDVDELGTGRRREGSFASVFSLLVKIGISLAVFVKGPMLELSGFEGDLGAAQPDGIFWRMRLMLAFIPAGIIGLGFFFLRAYTITESSADETRRALEARRGSLHTPESSQTP